MARLTLFLKVWWWAILLTVLLVGGLVWAFSSSKSTLPATPAAVVPAEASSLSAARAPISAAQKAADLAARIQVLEEKKGALEKASGDNGKLEEMIRVNEQLLELYAERTGLMIADAKIARSANAIKELNLAMTSCAKDVPCMLAAQAKANAARDAMNAPPLTTAPQVPAPAPAVVVSASPVTPTAPASVAVKPAAKTSQRAPQLQPQVASGLSRSSTQQCVQMPPGFACAKNQANLGYRECGCT